MPPSNKRKREDDEPRAAPGTSNFLQLRPADIPNKMKRAEIFARQKAEKARARTYDRKKRKKETAALGEEELALKRINDAKNQITIESKRVADETIVAADDEEVQADDAIDEFAPYFTEQVTPKIAITTCYNPKDKKRLYGFVRDLLHVFPNSFFYERKNFTIASIIDVCKEKEFTDVLIIHETKIIPHKIDGITHIHLPIGPTAYYRLSSVKTTAEMKNLGLPSSHKPELILNHFNTRLGHRLGRMLGCLFDQSPEFRGRRVVTFHNQRDFIFFRHHRYVFAAKDKATLQELGPRFTMKLRWLQHGTFDTQRGELEFKHSYQYDDNRRKFAL